ncbi:MAG: nuclear transport factor 2 family protein [Gammaproteobacteria bacterium]|jgi:3-phenylpropionate/cinnamic acid dioxygenase small subunit|nr:nuclear transport factor 2 family protein [Gammaproteobacteria bacterium]
MDGTAPVDLVALRSEIVDFLAGEAQAIDDRDWDTWLGLHEETVEYWIPAWDSEYETTSDPQAEMSLIYYNGRAGLEDRVFRLRTGRSAASTPLPRTCHMMSNIRVLPQADGTVIARTRWVVHLFRKGEQTQFFGHAEYLLVADPAGWKIRRKKVLVLNDLIPTVLDIYSV